LVLLSAIAQLPLRQDIAVTGAINQFGDVQAVGGINEKIEGFYQLCAQRGLTGEQGVIIPAINRYSLMLPEAICHACHQGLFHIWTADHLDDLLSQMTAQPAELVNAQVQKALEQMNPVEAES
jgi:predicted ATP-dependent protease